MYYLGVFDPQEQLPETVYRLTIHGQASAISGMKFGSGWVHADLIDSLNSRAAFDDSGRITITRSVPKKNEGDNTNGDDSGVVETVTVSKSRDSEFPSLETGRRLMLFGPEGFREAPKNHRLVVVMGSNPEAFFNAIDQSLGIVSEVFREQRNTGLAQKIFKAMIKIKDERQALTQLTVDIAKDMPETKGAQG